MATTYLLLLIAVFGFVLWLLFLRKPKKAPHRRPNQSELDRAAAIYQRQTGDQAAADQIRRGNYKQVTDDDDSLFFLAMLYIIMSSDDDGAAAAVLSDGPDVLDVDEETRAALDEGVQSLQQDEPEEGQGEEPRSFADEDPADDDEPVEDDDDDTDDD